MKLGAQLENGQPLPAGEVDDLVKEVDALIDKRYKWTMQQLIAPPIATRANILKKLYGLLSRIDAVTADEAIRLHMPEAYDTSEVQQRVTNTLL